MKHNDKTIFGVIIAFLTISVTVILASCYAPSNSSTVDEYLLRHGASITYEEAKAAYEASQLTTPPPILLSPDKLNDVDGR